MKTAYRALFCVALAFAGMVTANAAGQNSSILTGSGSDPLQADPIQAGSNTNTYNSYGSSAGYSNPTGPTGGVHSYYDSVPGPLAVGPFAIGLIAAFRRRGKKA